MPGQDAEALEILHNCQLAAHYLHVHNQAAANGWLEIAAKAATSLLRHIGTVRVGGATASVVPPDKAFYLAGLAWRRITDKRGQAFVFLNALLDIAEAVEDNSAAGLDMSDLVESGIPLVFVLPQREAAYVSDREMEEVKDWVLEISMQQDIDQRLAVRAGGDTTRSSTRTQVTPTLTRGARSCGRVPTAGATCTRARSSATNAATPARRAR